MDCAGHMGSIGCLEAFGHDLVSQRNKGAENVLIHIHRAIGIHEMLYLAGGRLVPVAAVLVIENDGGYESVLPLNYFFLDLHLGKGFQMDAELGMVIVRAIVSTAVKIGEQAISLIT